jgi:hypothetical protein
MRIPNKLKDAAAGLFIAASVLANIFMNNNDYRHTLLAVELAFFFFAAYAGLQLNQTNILTIIKELDSFIYSRKTRVAVEDLNKAATELTKVIGSVEDSKAAQDALNEVQRKGL